MASPAQHRESVEHRPLRVMIVDLLTPILLQAGQWLLLCNIESLSNSALSVLRLLTF